MKILKICLFILTILLFSTIYHFSDRTADESNKDSINLLIKIGLVTEEDVENNTAQYRQLHIVIRVFAHFTLFALLTLCLYLFIYAMTKKIMVTSVITFIVVVAWAILDEKHQLLIEGRSFELFDIYVDAFGGLLTVTTATSVNIVNKIINKGKLRKGSR